jgi:hypothetical protein
MCQEILDKTAYCGLYCGDCAFGTGAIPDLARDLRKALREAHFDKAAEVIPFKEFKQYPQCYEVLGAMVKLRCGGCRTSGRSKFCKIAQCARKKEVQGCWECAGFEDCKKLDFLATTHGDAHLKNLRKIRKAGLEEWAAGKRLWYSARKD